MTARKLEKNEWKPLSEGISNVLGTKQAEVEVLSLISAIKWKPNGCLF